MRSRLISRALIYNLDAHRANLPNLIAGAVGMFINNVIFLAGMWGMLFAGKTEHREMVPYFLALYAIVTASWGAVNFFLGGLRELGETISDGALEPMLATPRDPILLAAISRSSPVALGDLLMGLAGMIGIGIWLEPALALRCLMAASISAIGFAALFIAAGSLSFFIARGSNVGQLLIEMTVSLSVYPTGKMFSGAGRVALLLTPAAATAVLPLDLVESASVKDFCVAWAASIGFLVFAVVLFRAGVKRYRTVSLLGVRR